VIFWRFLAAKEWITTKWMEIDYDYLRTGTAIGFRASRELCSNYLFRLRSWFWVVLRILRTRRKKGKARKMTKNEKKSKTEWNGRGGEEKEVKMAGKERRINTKRKEKERAPNKFPHTRQFRFFKNMLEWCRPYAGGSCAAGWRHYAGNCYYASDTERDQPTAREECHEQDAELVSISNQQEMDFVASISWVDQSLTIYIILYCVLKD